MRRIYVASSWRNADQPQVVEQLREAGHAVYDFRHPPEGGNGFRWSDVSASYMDWSVSEYRDHLEHPLAVRQFENDLRAMQACDVCVLVLPCGKSAHMEAGWFAGHGKQVFVLMPQRQEPELMYRLFDGVFETVDELVRALSRAD